MLINVRRMMLGDELEPMAVTRSSSMLASCEVNASDARTDPEALLSDFRGQCSTSLHAATARGDTMGLIACLESGANVNTPGNLGWAPLHVAVLANEKACVEALIKFGAWVDQPFPNAATPLMLAIQLKHPGIAILLAESGSDLNLCWDRNWSVWDLVLESGCNDVLDAMLGFASPLSTECQGVKGGVLVAASSGNVDGLDKCLKCFPQAFQRRHQFVQMHCLAAQAGRVDVLRWLKTHNPAWAHALATNTHWHDHDHPDLYAALAGQQQAMDWLVAQGFDPWREHENSANALCLAASRGHLGVCKTIFDSEKQPNAHVVDRAYFLAKMRKHWDVAVFLLRQINAIGWLSDRLEVDFDHHLGIGSGRDLQSFCETVFLAMSDRDPSLLNQSLDWFMHHLMSKDPRNTCYPALALDEALRCGDGPMLTYLCTNQLFSNLLVQKEVSAVAKAACGGSASILSQCVARGLPIDEPWQHGATPLMLAALFGHDEAFDCLLKHGANPCATLSDGSDLLMMAACGDSVPIIDRLLAMGFDPERANQHGWSPLLFAALSDAIEAFTHLVDQRVSIARTSAEGMDVLMASAWMDAHKVFSCLCEQHFPFTGQSIHGDTVMRLAGEPIWQDATGYTTGVYEREEKEVWMEAFANMPKCMQPNGCDTERTVVQGPKSLPLPFMISECLASYAKRKPRIKNKHKSKRHTISRETDLRARETFLANTPLV